MLSPCWPEARGPSCRYLGARFHNGNKFGSSRHQFPKQHDKGQDGPVYRVTGYQDLRILGMVLPQSESCSCHRDSRRIDVVALVRHPHHKRKARLNPIKDRVVTCQPNSTMWRTKSPVPLLQTCECYQACEEWDVKNLN